MLARPVGVKVQAIAVDREHAILPVEADRVVLRAANVGRHAGFGTLPDAHPALPEVTVTALPHRSSEIAGESARQVHGRLIWGKARSHFILIRRKLLYRWCQTTI